MIQVSRIVNLDAIFRYEDEKAIGFQARDDPGDHFCVRRKVQRRVQLRRVPSSNLRIAVADV